MKLSNEPLIPAEGIARRVAELAAAVTRDYRGKDLIALAVLKGGAIFGADLLRALDIGVRLDFIRARSYRGIHSTGGVEILQRPEVSLRRRHVLLVEDILDTGRTTAAILDRLGEEEPASLELCVLLDKPARREVDVPARYVGFTIEDRFVVGYGLDYEEQYRNLPAIYTLE